MKQHQKNEIELTLDALWEAYGDMPFASSTIQHKLNLSHEEYQDILIFLNRMDDDEDEMFRYSVKRPTPTTYWMSKR